MRVDNLDMDALKLIQTTRMQAAMALLLALSIAVSTSIMGFALGNADLLGLVAPLTLAVLFTPLMIYCLVSSEPIGVFRC